MKNPIILLFLCLCFSTHTTAATSITTPTISGHWTLAGSPYNIHNNVTIDFGATLTIDSGVNVIFHGYYYLTVSGKLLSYGAPTAPVVFDIADTTGWHIEALGDTVGGWRGIFFDYYGSDTSALSFCNFHHLKKGMINVAGGSVVQVSNCDFSYNMGRIFDFYTLTPKIIEINNCSFHDNYLTYGAAIRMLNTETLVQFINNDVYNNKVGVVGDLISCTNSTIIISGNNIHHNYVHPGLDSVSQTGMLTFLSYGTRHCYATLTGNRIYENTSLLVAPIAATYSSVDISNNYICNNHNILTEECPYAFGGGGIYLLGNGDYGNTYGKSIYTVRNNIIANNYSSIFGGGIFIFNAKTLVAGNTIVNNKAPRGGGIDIVASDTITMCFRNNIFYGNENEGHPEVKGDIALLTLITTNIRFDHNWTDTAWYGYITTGRSPTLWGGITQLSDLGTNVTGANPGMAHPTLTANYTESALLADFSLLPGAPCINKGCDSAVATGSTDFLGNNRILDTVDIGAIEFGASAAGIAPAILQDTIFSNCCYPITRYPYIEPPVHTTQSTFAPVINCYPNPTSTVVYIATPASAGTILLQDIAGKVVASSPVSNSRTTLDVTALPRGIYFVIWVYRTQRAIHKIIVE